MDDSLPPTATRAIDASQIPFYGPRSSRVDRADRRQCRRIEPGFRSMNDRVKDFADYRRKMNERLLAEDNRVIKRMFSLDSLTYAEGGALDVKHKELLGLVASLVLRCDDCVSYHIGQSLEAGATRDEIVETMSIGLVVGGTIVIPHLRRATEFLDALTGQDA
jgi:AhpD family alkylhydroperoxidase